MKRLLSTLAFIFWASAAGAEFNGCPPGLCNTSTSSAPPVTSCQLIFTMMQTGSCAASAPIVVASQYPTLIMP